MDIERIQQEFLRWMDQDVSDEEVDAAIRSVPCHYAGANLTMAFTLNGQVTFSPAASGGSTQANMTLNQGDWLIVQRQFSYANDDLFPASVAHGTLAYFNQLTANAGSNQNLDLTALTMAGATINFTKLKYSFIQLVTPTTPGTDFLKVGPQSIANHYQGKFDAVTDYESIYWDQELHFDPYGSLASVSGTNKILGITNSGANNIKFNILLVGR